MLSGIYGEWSLEYELANQNKYIKLKIKKSKNKLLNSISICCV